MIVEHVIRLNVTDEKLLREHALNQAAMSDANLGENPKLADLLQEALVNVLPAEGRQSCLDVGVEIYDWSTRQIH